MSTGKAPLTLDIQAMTREEAIALSHIDPILKRLGLSLFCLRCHHLGIPDGVQGLNDPQGRELNVACGCTIRRYIRR